MSDDCQHEWRLSQITIDPNNRLQQIEWAYYYCNICLETVKVIVNTPTTNNNKER